MTPSDWVTLVEKWKKRSMEAERHLELVLLVAKGAEMLLTGEALGPMRLGEEDQLIIEAADAFLLTGA